MHPNARADFHTPSQSATPPPSRKPTGAPAIASTNTPSSPPSNAPSLTPSYSPSLAPTQAPTLAPVAEECKAGQPATPEELKNLCKKAAEYFEGQLFDDKISTYDPLGPDGEMAIPTAGGCYAIPTIGLETKYILRWYSGHAVMGLTPPPPLWMQAISRLLITIEQKKAIVLTQRPMSVAPCA